MWRVDAAGGRPGWAGSCAQLQTQASWLEQVHASNGSAAWQLLNSPTPALLPQIKTGDALPLLQYSCSKRVLPVPTYKVNARRQGPHYL